MSLQPRNSDLRCTFTRIFRKLQSDLDLQNNVLIFVSDIPGNPNDIKEIRRCSNVPLYFLVHRTFFFKVTIYR